MSLNVLIEIRSCSGTLNVIVVVEIEKENIYRIHNTIHMYSGITSGIVLNGELLYTKILEVNLFAFAYRLFHKDFSPIQYVPLIGEKSL